MRTRVYTVRVFYTHILIHTPSILCSTLYVCSPFRRCNIEVCALCSSGLNARALHSAYKEPGATLICAARPPHGFLVANANTDTGGVKFKCHLFDCLHRHGSIHTHIVKRTNNNPSARPATTIIINSVQSTCERIGLNHGGPCARTHTHRTCTRVRQRIWTRESHAVSCEVRGGLNVGNIMYTTYRYTPLHVLIWCGQDVHYWLLLYVCLLNFYFINNICLMYRSRI